MFSDSESFRNNGLGVERVRESGETKPTVYVFRLDS